MYFEQGSLHLNVIHYGILELLPLFPGSDVEKTDRASSFWSSEAAVPSENNTGQVIKKMMQFMHVKSFNSIRRIKSVYLLCCWSFMFFLQ